jgi:hypothetical protein
VSKSLTPAVKGDASTAGGAMETLGKPEWFTAPEPNKAKNFPPNSGGTLTPFAYVFYVRRVRGQSKDS